MIEWINWVIALLCFVILSVVLRIWRVVKEPDAVYVKVYLVLRSEKDPKNIGKQWLLEKFTHFRIVPRVGDTLDLENGQFPVVTEVQLRKDRTCTVWCDVDVIEDELEKTASSYLERFGWYTDTSRPALHHKVYGGKHGRLKRRKGNGFKIDDV